jgi:hypothetical protein
MLHEIQNSPGGHDNQREQDTRPEDVADHQIQSVVIHL